MASSLPCPAAPSVLLGRPVESCVQASGASLEPLHHHFWPFPRSLIMFFPPSNSSWRSTQLMLAGQLLFIQRPVGVRKSLRIGGPAQGTGLWASEVRGQSSLGRGWHLSPPTGQALGHRIFSALVLLLFVLFGSIYTGGVGAIVCC